MDPQSIEVTFICFAHHLITRGDQHTELTRHHRVENDPHKRFQVTVERRAKFQEEGSLARIRRALTSSMDIKMAVP